MNALEKLGYPKEIYDENKLLFTNGGQIRILFSQEDFGLFVQIIFLDCDTELSDMDNLIKAIKKVKRSIEKKGLAEVIKEELTK